jgi:hypothetical protein
MIPLTIFNLKMKHICIECLQKLKKDEIALSMKLFGVDTEDFYCLECMSDYLECPIYDLQIKIQEFKEQGCSLFL